MGENVKPEEKKEEEEPKKPAEEPKEEKTVHGHELKIDVEKKDDKQEGKETPSPPPPEEFEYRVFMHCEGCARKVKRSLRGFSGVEGVITDCKAHRVVVKGKTADPLKVLDQIQRKSHGKVELLTPLPVPPQEDPMKAEEKEKPKEEEKKEEPQVIIATLRVHMHCEACAQGIKKRIQRMKGVQSVDPDLKNSLVTVKGVVDPEKLVEYLYKKTGKHASVVKQEPEKQKVEEKGKGKEGEEKKEGGDEKKGEGEKKKDEKDGGEKTEEETWEEETKLEVRKNEYLYYHPIYQTEHVYPPQIFSDENPNACTVM